MLASAIEVYAKVADHFLDVTHLDFAISALAVFSQRKAGVRLGAVADEPVVLALLLCEARGTPLQHPPDLREGDPP